MLKKILLVTGLLLVCLVGGLWAAIAMQPSYYSVQRTATMAAPPSDVFAIINDVQAWDAWSSWKDLDPNAKSNISNPSAGVGASISWNGNDEIGEGSLTILTSRPDELVEVEQEFVRPMPGKARMLFALSPKGNGTNVTWTLAGTNDFFGKAVCLFMDLDARIGPAFAQGLANMQTVVEKTAAAPAADSESPPPDSNEK